MLPLRPTYQLFILCLFLAFMNGCSWTPRVETSIYEGPQASVSLITASEESFQADHPTTIQTDNIEHVLRGLRIRQNNRLLQKIFSSNENPQPIFTEGQIATLTPQLQKAFSQITPEEQIRIQTPGNQENEIRSINGTMYLKRDDLYVSLTINTHNSHSSPKSSGKGVRPDQEGRGTPIVVFSPQEALRIEKQSHWLLGGGKEKNRVVINIPLLASLQQPISATLPPNEGTPRPHLGADPKSNDTMSKNPDQTPNPRSKPQPQTSAQIPEHSDIQTLMEEIKALRKELAEQKKTIEGLKQEEAETR